MAIKAKRIGWVVIIGCLLLAVPTRGHETDQFTLPEGREFAELGPHMNAWAYRAIDLGVRKTNQRIEAAVKAKRGAGAISQLQHPDELVRAVNSEFADAYSLIEGMETMLHSNQMQRKYPGKVVGYKKQIGNIFQHVHFILDPRQFFRLWHASTFKAWDTYLGTDKVGHFTDMGMHYYRAYSTAKRKGASDEQAFRDAVEVGTHGPLFSERGMVGYLSAGAYSNADLAANFVGFLFYLNLTQEVMLKGQKQPPMVQLQGDLWVIAPHVTSDSGFFAVFISDHLNEALNPSLFESAMRSAVRTAIRERKEIVLARLCDEHGNRRPQAYFDRMVKELSTYYGQPYGYEGSIGELVTVGNTCFESLPSTAAATARDFSGNTPLHQAAANGDTFAARKLIDGGADVNVTVRSDEGYSSEWGNTPLHEAAASGRLEVCTLLLEAHALVNARNDRGQTPLHRAVTHPAVAAKLIENMATVDAVDGTGQTPLHWAAMDGQIDTVELLLKNGADPNARDNSGQTPLHVAIRLGFGDAAKALIARGADVNAKDRLDIAPVHLAAARGETALLELLLEHGASLSAQDQFGWTALHEAAAKGRSEAVSLLLARSMPIDIEDQHANTPLHLAARRGKLSVVTLLVERGANVNARNSLGSVPLHEASSTNQLAIVDYLLKRGADAFIIDNRGSSALQIAANRGHDQVAARLKTVPPRSAASPRPLPSAVGSGASTLGAR